MIGRCIACVGLLGGGEVDVVVVVVEKEGGGGDLGGGEATELPPAGGWSVDAVFAV